jgi:hypothetical protein
VAGGALSAGNDKNSIKTIFYEEIPVLRHHCGKLLSGLGPFGMDVAD